jgi:hypothetical protein
MVGEIGFAAAVGKQATVHRTLSTNQHPALIVPTQHSTSFCSGDTATSTTRNGQRFHEPGIMLRCRLK